MNVSKATSNATIKIGNIRSGMRQLTVKAQVTARAPVDLRSQRTAHAVATVSDDTGVILLNLWRDQINQVQVGDWIILRDGFARKYKGKLELSTWTDTEKAQNLSNSD